MSAAAVPPILGGETKRVPTASLLLYPGNPRRGNIAAIEKSLARNGQYTPLTLNARTGHVLKGNHTLLAARELGWREIDVFAIDVSEEAEKRIVLADNRTSDLATYDLEELAALLAEVGSYEGTGYDPGDVDALLAELSAGIPVAEDEVPPLPAEPVTQLGDVVQLGEHLLVCGDARNPAAYAPLIESEEADILLTDLPYGVDYAGKTKARLTIRNDDPDGLPDLLNDAFSALDAVLRQGAPLYVFHPAGPQCLLFMEAFRNRGWRPRQDLVWAKDAMVLGHADYHYAHEGILYGFKPGRGRLGRGGLGWYGDNRQTSVLSVPRPRAAREHPTMKPAELLAILLRNSSRRRELVLDPFAGSGSIIVACEQLGRRARLIELDPGYCDVIITRYEQLTGNTASRPGK